jgi:cysteine-rich repeat protein
MRPRPACFAATDPTVLEAIMIRSKSQRYVLLAALVGILMLARSPAEAGGTSGYCGDGIPQEELGEECDDGNDDDTDLCTNACRISVCGDGIVRDPDIDFAPRSTPPWVEDCDDGNTEDGDGCSRNCKFEGACCGAFASCELMTETFCVEGAGIFQGDGTTCAPNPCGSCGDGIVQEELGEECDDGNTAGGDGCSSSCESEDADVCATACASPAAKHVNARNAVLVGSGTADILCGDERDNVIRGTAGPDIVCGFGGNDTLYGHLEGDFLDGGEGDDHLRGEAGDDTILGCSGDDAIHGHNGADVLDGGPGNDTIRGGADGDVLEGGPGTDLLNGEGGSDSCDGGESTSNCP